MGIAYLFHSMLTGVSYNFMNHEQPDLRFCHLAICSHSVHACAMTGLLSNIFTYIYLASLIKINIDIQVLKTNTETHTCIDPKKYFDSQA